MTTPSVGAIVAMTYKSALDNPGRIKKSRNAGPLFGLTPKIYQSGETDVTGGITRVGDEMVRTALYEAANVLLSRPWWARAVTENSAWRRLTDIDDGTARKVLGNDLIHGRSPW
jgi:transposase